MGNKHLNKNVKAMKDFNFIENYKNYLKILENFLIPDTKIMKEFDLIL